MCLFGRFHHNQKYKANKKNGGVIPAITDLRLLYVPIKCGQCIECCKQKAREFQSRLMEDIKTNTNGKFVTLTFSDESYAELYNDLKIKTENPYLKDNAIATLGLRRFLERWRKDTGKSIRHFLVTELGHEGTENIHLHGILWTNETVNTVAKRWKYGYIWPRYNWEKNYVNNQTVNYIIKYIIKRDEKHKHYKSIILTSAGIGGNYTKTGNYKSNKYAGERTMECYRTGTGHKITLPIYWRNKIYSEEEREKLWLQKLDKQERWILGNKVDISKNDIEYLKGLEYARQRNKELGYGDGTSNKEQEEYEWQQRELQQQTRLQKAYNNNKNKAPEDKSTGRLNQN